MTGNDKRGLSVEAKKSKKMYLEICPFCAIVLPSLISGSVPGNLVYYSNYECLLSGSEFRS